MSKGRRIAKSIGKSIRKKFDDFDADIFLFPFGFWLEDQKSDFAYASTQYKSSSDSCPVSPSPDSCPLSPDREFIFMRMQSVQPPKKSCSLGTIATSEMHSPSIINHDEILALTQEVKKFSDSLGRLRLMFTEGIEPEEDSRVLIHEGLGEVLSVLNPVMQNYPALQSQDIFTAAKSLIDMIKDHNYEETINIQFFCDAIDQLALAFSSSVSDYLMGDIGPQIVMNLKTRSMNNIAGEETIQDNITVKLSTEEQDQILTVLDKGVSLALQRAKVCSKYISDIITYLEKKTQLEQDYAKNLSRLANTVQNSLKKDGFLPLQSVFCTALSQDVDFSSSLQTTQAVIHSHKFVEPLAVRKLEHDKAYKYIKEAWHREHRKMSESISNLRKAQNLYNTRQQDCERAHELSLKADGEKLEKRRKAEEEAVHKAAEAETTYKACVAEANFRQQELFKVKKELLAKVREQIQQCDLVIKEVTVEYFQLYHSIMSPLPLQYQTLSESSKVYEPGSQYAEFLRRLPKSAQQCEPEVFVFEPYVQGQRTSDESRKESFHSNGSVSDHHSPEGSPIASPKKDKYRLPVKAWGQIPNVVTTSDTDSASCSSKSHESSPSGSPHRTPRRLVSSQSLDELTEEELIAAAAHAAHHNQEKRSQQMKRTLTVAGEDGLDIPSLLIHRGRRNTTFGVDFQEQVDNFQSKVPPIVTKCLSEIEKRGVMIKGIYRVSGVKSKVENLCQKFDLDPEAVDLSEIHPNVISNVLKLYLRQLPEPLLTFRLYSDFIHTAKENMSGQLLNNSLIEHLKNLVCKLPASNLRTCAVLMHHLQRVASQSDFNQMSASNLGIVFGPTLLRPLEGSASLASLVDTPHQTRAIELLITYAHLVFGPSEDFQIAPTQSPVEQLNQALDGILLPAQGLAKMPVSSSQKPKVQSSGSEEQPVFDPVLSPSVNQPWQCEAVLPGTVSQEMSEAQTAAELDLDDGSEMGSDDSDDLPDLLLPDQSKQLSDPLSVTLNARCIQGSEQSGHNTSISKNMPSYSGAYCKPSVTKPSSSPVMSRCNKGVASGSDMVAALTSSAAGMASMLIMSAGTFPFEENSPKPPVVKQKDLIESQEKVLALDSLAQNGDGGQSLQVSDQGKDSENTESKKTQEEASKKKLHSLQLENIKYLTQPPSSQEPFPSLSPSALVVCSSSPQGPKLTPSDPDSKPLTSSSTSPQPALHAPASHSVSEPPSASYSPHGNVKATATSRRSILEEMPIPTLSKPGEMGADAVTIPASPTIKRKEIPSKIPTSPSTQRSFDSKLGFEKGDDRADRFRQEQRKLVKAIKSDAKLGTAPSHFEVSQESPEKDMTSLSRSGIFDDMISGGCALSSRPSSQSEDTCLELTSMEVKSSKSGPGGLSVALVDPSSTNIATPSGSPLTKPLRSSTWTGKTEVAKSTTLISRQRPASSAGELNPLTKTATSRVRALNTPSTSFAKKSVNTSTRSSTSSIASTASAPVRLGSGRTGSTTKSGSVTSEQSPQLCPRAAANCSRTLEELSSVKPGAVNKKGTGRELSVSQKSGKVFSEKIGMTTKTDGDVPFDKSSQSSSPRYRHPSGDSNHFAKQGQRRTLSSSGLCAGIPHTVQDRGQGEKSTSLGLQQTSKVISSSSLSQPQPPSSTQMSSALSVSSGNVKLSQDRTPRFV
ncbi:Rho GTPase-activating protein 45 [Bulinus truncatus]|nr:Rho GTPase-activating protein 45 [Bulinus truncatus]